MFRIEQHDALRIDIVRIVKVRNLPCVVIAAVCTGAVHGLPSGGAPSLADAQSLFYNGRYTEAAALTLALRASDAADLANTELRTSALLFQLKALLEGDRDKDKDAALEQCTTCPELIAEFLADVRRGQTLAHARLRATPGDETALFFLGKLDLNYVWLQLGPLGRKTGWDEYWEARHSLDAVLKSNPSHVRARVARAWISYVVDTRMPWGTRWLLGGGNRKQALRDIRAAAQIESDFYTHAEAEFALWEMHVRERDLTQATEVARRLAHDFPDNREVARFLEAREASSRR
jgi:hypothetical protein